MTTLRALGSSMFPFVPSGTWLELEALCGEEPARAQAQVGEIVAYVGRMGVIAHRVVGVDRSGISPLYELRGDAQDFSEIVSRDALAYRVTRVSYAGLSYATSGWLGRAAAYLALRGWSLRWLGLAVRAVRRFRQALS
jgi:hypothetical protein